MVIIDLDDTTQCPLDEACAACGTTADLDVATYGAQGLGGVMCVTVCRDCVSRPPRMAVVVAANRVAHHCEHLGIDLDRMAAIVEENAVLDAGR